MSKFYCQLSHFPLIDPDIVNEGIDAVYEQPVLETGSEIIPRVTKSPTSFKATKFCQDLCNKFGDVRPWFFRNNPMTVYDWHADASRSCAINFLLNEVSTSLTLFRQATDTRLMYNIFPCTYTLYQPILFNTTISHCVINNSNEYRYILSIGFPTTTDYNSVKEFLLQYQTSKY